LLVAVLAEKDLPGILAGLVGGERAVVATSLASPRARAAAEVAEAARAAGATRVESVDDPLAALERARELAGPGGLVLATGSVRLAGLFRGYRPDGSSRLSRMRT
jgi:dihydrofolate synthase/folylpolyglutamate synthase